MSKTTPYRRPFKRFMRWFVVLLGVYFLLTATMSLVINPWRINQTPLSMDGIDESRDISETVRVGKAAMANMGDWEVVFLGSSRMEIAFDPAHPVFEGRKTVNLAMSAATMLEALDAGHYTLKRNPGIQTVILGIDVGDISTDRDTRAVTGYYESPFADNNHSIERGINQVIGARSLLDSIATIKRHISGGEVIRNPDGLWVRPTNPGNLRRYIENSFKLRPEETGSAWMGTSPDSGNRGKVRALKKFIKQARQAGIRLIIVVPPQHALKQIHFAEDRPSGMFWDKELKLLSDICMEANRQSPSQPAVELWSFLTFNDFTTRPMPAPDAEDKRMEHWYDLGHCHTGVGDAAIETIFGNRDDASSATGIGINLLADDWASIRNSWIDAHEQYCNDHSEDVAWWRSLYDRALERKSDFKN